MGLLDYILLFFVMGILITPFIISKIKNRNKKSSCGCGCDRCNEDCPMKNKISKIANDLKKIN